MGNSHALALTGMQSKFYELRSCNFLLFLTLKFLTHSLPDDDSTMAWSLYRVLPKTLKLRAVMTSISSSPVAPEVVKTSEDKVDIMTTLGFHCNVSLKSFIQHI